MTDVRHARVARLRGILVQYLVESASLREMFADQLQELRGNICLNNFGIRWVKPGDVTLTVALLLDILACFLRKFHSVRETTVSQCSSIDRRCIIKYLFLFAEISDILSLIAAGMLRRMFGGWLI